MRSTAQIANHPIHPMLIPYPFVLLTSGVAFELASRAGDRADWRRTARQLTTLGLGSALVAAVPGIIDYLGTTPPRSAARSTARRHALSNVSALACFALARARRPAGDGPLPPSGIALSLLGTALLITAGLLGSTLVYHHHVGSVEPAEEAPLRRHASEEAAAAAPIDQGGAASMTTAAGAP